MKNANLQMLQLDTVREEQLQKDLSVRTHWSDPVPTPHSGKQAPFPTSSNPNS